MDEFSRGSRCAVCKVYDEALAIDLARINEALSAAGVDPIVLPALSPEAGEEISGQMAL